MKFSAFVGYVHMALLTKKYALKLEHFRYMGDKTCEKTAIGRLSANVRILERAEGVPVDPITL